MKKRKLPLFYKIYFALLLIFAVCLAVFAYMLNGYIREYNEGIPETVSEKFFNETFEQLDIDKIIEMSGIAPSEFETNEDIKAFVSSHLSNDLTYTSISSESGDTAKNYIVKSGEYKLASFTLVPDENNDYAPASLELHLPKTYQKEIKLLDSSTLYINGVAVDSQYVIEREPHKSAESLPENVKAPEWLTYKVSGLTKDPEVKVVDRNGQIPELSETDGILCEQIVYDPEESEITERLLTAAKQYAKCMQSDASKGSVLAYYEKGTPLYESIRTVENMFVWDHYGYAFEDESISEFMRYDENTVSVRISFTHILKRSGNQDYRDITDITFFARNVNGKYMIFSQHNNSQS